MGYKRISVQRFIKFGILLISLVVLVHVLTLFHMNSVSLKSDRSEYVKYIEQGLHNRKPRNVNTKYKVLFWLPFNNKNQMKYESTCMQRCPVKCELTSNKEDISQVDMVNFHLTDLWTEIWKINTKSIIQFPSYRRPDQIWMLTNREPPPNLYGNLRVFNGIFNWTLWYRKDATLHLPYGYATSLDENEAVVERSRNYYKEKSREVTGVISNCKDTNRRYRFIKELSKYLDITMFGYCYNNVCGDRMKHASCDNVTRQYKFYLSFENSKCKDYVSEKYWQALHRGQIPIVNWDLSTINKDIPIPGSYISVSDFKDVQTLANHIKRVSVNETLYNSYLSWRRRYKVGKSCISCIACKALHEARPPQVIDDLDGWVQDDTCKKVDGWNNYITQWDEYLFWKLGI
ncbi:alpha-(1,3)-fucosyltransferase 7-like [Ruditapes philippinarum]|uniref:alpha-(1,3)-fucosyltransferase 7-like n=1 Tax=Ruditapes philippinarum TaxID=129788 RepID=UPI00295A7C8E|nr:alpha-(1,3)-fucosyltransferase 7-like [Ruditapes philippinarum]